MIFLYLANASDSIISLRQGLSCVIYNYKMLEQITQPKNAEVASVDHSKKDGVQIDFTVILCEPKLVLILATRSLTCRNTFWCIIVCSR